MGCGGWGAEGGESPAFLAPADKGAAAVRWRKGLKTDKAVRAGGRARAGPGPRANKILKSALALLHKQNVDQSATLRVAGLLTDCAPHPRQS